MVLTNRIVIPLLLTIFAFTTAFFLGYIGVWMLQEYGDWFSISLGLVLVVLSIIIILWLGFSHIRRRDYGCIVRDGFRTQVFTSPGHFVVGTSQTWWGASYKVPTWVETLPSGEQSEKELTSFAMYAITGYGKIRAQKLVDTLNFWISSDAGTPSPLSDSFESDWESNV